jgi:hypothetical protein
MDNRLCEDCKHYVTESNGRKIVQGCEVWECKFVPKDAGCSECILDKTDACSRGAGRAVNDEVCDDFIGGKR